MRSSPTLDSLSLSQHNQRVVFGDLIHYYLLSVVVVCLEDVNQSVVRIANTKPPVRMPNTLPIRKGNDEVQYLDCSLEGNFLKNAIVNHIHTSTKASSFFLLLAFLSIPLMLTTELDISAIVGHHLRRIFSADRLFATLWINPYVRQHCYSRMQQHHTVE